MDRAGKTVEDERREATEAILRSDAPRKLVVAGPGTGKTYLFRQLLGRAPGSATNRLVLTFINTLTQDLKTQLGGDAQVQTLHSYCLSALKRKPALRPELTDDFRCQPYLAGLIKEDWVFLRGCEAPEFVAQMRSLDVGEDLDFYLNRGSYYDAVDFDDSVFRVYSGWSADCDQIDEWKLVLIDEFQDFNRLEAGIIDLLATQSPIVIAGDDDQALYSQLRDATWDCIRELHGGGDYEVHRLPFCMRCTEVLVAAVNDVVTRARREGGLDGRIDKPYRYYPPHKGDDSNSYPYIDYVSCSVQRQNANYMGKYIEQQVGRIPDDEIAQAIDSGDVPALVIGQKQYLDQIERHLKESGLAVERRSRSGGKLTREDGLQVLREDSDSNLGWRIVLKFDKPDLVREVVQKTAETGEKLAPQIPEDFRIGVIQEAQDLEEDGEDGERNETKEDPALIKLVSFEGAKGLSAQHVYVVGVHRNELPRHQQSIQDLEVCKFLVCLTRAQKKCSFICTGRFAGNQRWPSVFLSWIRDVRFNRVAVNAAYWE